MSKNKASEEAVERLSKYSGQTIDICTDLYKLIIETEPDVRIQVFKTICENFGRIESDDSLEIPCGECSVSLLNHLTKTYGSLVDELLDSTLKKSIDLKYTEDEFYKVVWDKVVNNSIFEDDSLRIFSMYYILIDPRIPYYSINKGVYMEDSEYSLIFESLRKSINKLNFILSFNFEQKTQEASNLLDLILEQKNYKTQVVLLSYAINDIKKQQRLIDKMEFTN